MREGGERGVNAIMIEGFHSSPPLIIFTLNKSIGIFNVNL